MLEKNLKQIIQTKYCLLRNIKSTEYVADKLLWYFQSQEFFFIERNEMLRIPLFYISCIVNLFI